MFIKNDNVKISQFDIYCVIMQIFILNISTYYSHLD